MEKSTLQLFPIVKSGVFFNKMQIKRAFVDLYEEEVERVNTHITPKGEKVAYIKLVEEEMAEELAVRIGVF